MEMKPDHPCSRSQAGYGFAPIVEARLGSVGSLRPRHLASRVIGPVAVDADHAPFDARNGADLTAVLHDRIVHCAPPPVGNQYASSAEAPRNRAVGPGPERHLAHTIKVGDPESGIPELAFLFTEARLDGRERPGDVTGR